MNGWIKHFADNTVEVGSDEDISRKKASWSRGRLDQMVGAELMHEGRTLTIQMPGKYWQSDDYVVEMYQQSPRLVTRRIQKQLQEGDVFCIYHQGDSILATRYTPEKFENFACNVCIVTEVLAGKWLTLEYNLETGRLNYSIQEDRI